MPCIRVFGYSPCLASIPLWGIVVNRGGRDLDDRGGLQAVPPDGLSGLVGPGPRLRDLGDRAGVGAASADRVGSLRQRRRAACQGDWPRRGLLLLLVCRDR